MMKDENAQGIADHIAFAVFLAVSESKLTREQWVTFCGRVYDTMIETTTHIVKEHNTHG